MTRQGISVSNDGVLSGTVTSGGTYQVTIQVTDTYETDQATLTLQVDEAIAEAPSAPDATPIGGLVEDAHHRARRRRRRRSAAGLRGDAAARVPP